MITHSRDIADVPDMIWDGFYPKRADSPKTGLQRLQLILEYAYLIPIILFVLICVVSMDRLMRVMRGVVGSIRRDR